MLPPPRPYQERGERAIRAAVAKARAGGEEYPGVVAVAPTGAGKTAMYLRMAAQARAKGNRTLITVPRRELASQPYRKIKSYGWEDVRVLRSAVDGGDEGPEDASVIVSTVQTLIARDWLPDNVKFAVFDEGRHYVADGWGRVGAGLMQCVRVLFDATPHRADGRGFRPLASQLIEVASVRELVDGGYLVPSTIYAPADVQKALARRPVDAYLAKVPGKRCIVYAARVEHARLFAAEFKAAGIACEVVSGKSKDRDGPLARLRSGETLVLCNCGLYVEGLDVVEVEAIIIARGVSLTTLRQMGGRALRPSPHTGKTHAYVLDLVGTSRLYGALDVPYAWSLDGKAPRPKEPLPPTVQCRKCHAWGPGGGVCTDPRCLAPMPPAPPPRVRPRELSAVRSGDSADVRRERLARWVADALARGGNPWQAAYKYRGTYAETPPRAWVVEAIAAAQVAA